MTNYQKAIALLESVVKYLKKKHKKDNRTIVKSINKNVCFLIKEFNLSDFEASLLDDYASTLHPKK